MIGSLRGRLFASFVAVVLVMVTTTTFAAIWPLMDVQQTLQRRQLEDMTAQIAIGVDAVFRRPGLRPLLGGELLHELGERTGTRLLIMDTAGRVLVDSSEEPLAEATRGALAERVGRTGLATRPRPGDSASGARYLGALDQYHVAVAPLSSVPGSSLVVLAPEPTRVLLRALLPGLGSAVVIGLAVSLAVTWVLSRSIAGPIAHLAAVADAIAAGDLSQQAVGEKPNEVGRLVRSFNAMVDNLRRLVESQQNLLTNVAHELRTPLTVIQGYAQAVREGLLDEPSDRDEALRLIGEESERAARLLTQLLQLTRLETGQVTLQRQPVVLAPVVGRVVARHRLDLQQRAITLHVDIPDHLTAAGDPELLEQALENLVQNALVHGRDGMELTLTARPSPTSTKHLAVVVRDTGPGIPPHDLPHLFDRFYRGESRGERRDGFGLGLAIVRDIVTLHGGTIEVSSEPGRGTTFTLILPVYSGQE
ncbi:MAG: HAMP domain-containing histidine kinase [Thermomicrobium sp.]|nr:HAMP domain-containing histidine kinase [Thermomicrobium sp.]MDW7981277.1 HAMP domain-containing sensor histidine kinase [Thermomicrobium sp.]